MMAANIVSRVRGHQFGIVETFGNALALECDSRRDHRAGKRTAPRLIHTGHRPTDLRKHA